jgi:hypothetical protein
MTRCSRKVALNSSIVISVPPVGLYHYRNLRRLTSKLFDDAAVVPVSYEFTKLLVRLSGCWSTGYWGIGVLRSECWSVGVLVDHKNRLTTDNRH